jgi:glycosyltransferase involved in cell wall biosynthesis
VGENRPIEPRVAFLTDIPTPYMLRVLEALSERLDLTALFCAATGSRAMPWSNGAQNGLKTKVVGGMRIPRGSPNGTDYYLSPRIFRELARLRPDAIVSGGFSFPTLYASAYSSLSRRPFLVYSDGTLISEGGISSAQRRARSLLLKRASGAVAKSAPAADRFRELGAHPVFMAPHSTNMEPLWAVAGDRAYRRDPGLRLITVGRLIPRKGIDRLLGAVRDAREEIGGIELTVVGTGPEEDRLRAMARDLGLGDVRFTGFQEAEQIPALLADADAFAFPTMKDPFGLALLEAAATGLPSISSPFAGATEDLIADGANGLVVDPGDPRALSAAIVRLARDPAASAEMGRKAHLVTLGRTPQAAADGYVEAIRNALERRGAGR